MSFFYYTAIILPTNFALINQELYICTVQSFKIIPPSLALKPYIRYYIIKKTVIGIPLVSLALLCDHWIIGFYTNNEELIRKTVAPFIVMPFNYVFAVPGYIYISAISGTGKTKTAFIFQATTIVVYLIYLYWLSNCVHAPLAVYVTTEYLFMIMLGVQSVSYLKKKRF